jgi:hypothetical protein
MSGIVTTDIVELGARAGRFHAGGFDVAVRCSSKCRDYPANRARMSGYAIFT